MALIGLTHLAFGEVLSKGRESKNYVHMLASDMKLLPGLDDNIATGLASRRAKATRYLLCSCTRLLTYWRPLPCAPRHLLAFHSLVPNRQFLWSLQLCYIDIIALPLPVWTI
jgi:hypothetical protein